MAESGPARKIVVVEDDVYIRRLLHDLLKFQGYAPEIFEKADAVLTALKAGKGISLLIADESMDGMTGSELVIALRKADIGVPAIILGPIDSPYWGALKGDLGRVEVVDKPFHTAQLISVIDRMLTA